MNIEELKARMHGFLENDYDAYFFMEEFLSKFQKETKI